MAQNRDPAHARGPHPRLLVGELISGLLQVESQMRLEAGGGASHYSESYRLNELAILDTTNPDYDEVVAIPEDPCSVADGGESIQHPKLPFQLRIRDYYPNATIQMRDQVPNAPPALATAGIGSRLAVTPLPITYKQDERNTPAADLEIVTPEGTQGILLRLVPSSACRRNSFPAAGHTSQLALRFKRYYFVRSRSRCTTSPTTSIPARTSRRISRAASS